MNHTDFLNLKPGDRIIDTSTGVHLGVIKKISEVAYEVYNIASIGERDYIFDDMMDNLERE